VRYHPAHSLSPLLQLLLDGLESPEENVLSCRIGPPSVPRIEYCAKRNALSPDQSSSSRQRRIAQYQFGGTLGGRFGRIRRFSSGLSEAVKEQLGVTGLTNVLDDNARNSATGAVSSLVQILFRGEREGARGRRCRVLIHEKQPTDEYFAQGRIDHHFPRRTSCLAATPSTTATSPADQQ